MLKEYEKISKRLQHDYDLVTKMGYEVVGIFLQGSQNYDLAYEASDIDTKAIVLPKFNDIVLNNKPVSTTHILDTNEHIDLKDIRLMFDCFKKQNINFVEILFTQYHLLNSSYMHLFEPIMEHAEEVARYNIYASLNCMAGMSMEKFKALEHPYPATLEKIERFGYDPKQLHHIIRIYDFMKRYIDGEPYANCLIPTNKEYLVEVKKGIIPLEDARHIAKTMCEITNILKNKYMEEHPASVNTAVDKLLNSVLINILKESFKKELL